jgi:hypothetical protein
MAAARALRRLLAAHSPLAGFDPETNSLRQMVAIIEREILAQGSGGAAPSGPNASALPKTK